MNRSIIAALLITVTFGAFAGAQPLADRVPESTLVYVGWRGGDSMGPAFAESHLKAILDSSNLRAVFDEVLPRVLANAARRGGPEAADFVNTFNTIAPPFWKYPTAIYFGIDLSGGQPMPHAALLCKAGKDALAVQKKLDELLSHAKPSPVPVRTFIVDQIVGLSIGYEDGEMALAGTGGDQVRPLSTSTEFTNALAKVGNDPAAIIYVDGDNLLKLLDDAIGQSPDLNLVAKWANIREASGLANFHRLIATAGFDGKDWSDQLFVEAPPPRKGLFTIFDTAPISDDELKIIPATATTVAACGFDPAKLITEARAAVVQVDADAGVKFDQALGIVQMYVGKNLVRDILEPLGEHWIAYDDPNTAGFGYAGLVVVNKLDDPAKASQGLSALTIAINNTLAGALRNKGVEIAVRQTKVGDLVINYIAVPLISPAWTIKDGNLYLGLYPQTVATAVQRSNGGKSILDNPDFVAVRKRLGVEHPTSLTFVDLPKTAPHSYQGLLALSRLALGLADVFGGRTPEMVLPPMDVLLKHIAPMGSASWTDDAGFHSKTITPFPGSELLGGQLGIGPAIGAPMMMASIMIPSLSRARESANRVKCASNMRQIGQGIRLWSLANNGKFPPDLGALAVSADVNFPPEIYICPDSGKKVPANYATMTNEQKAALVNDHTDYIYLGATMNNTVAADADAIVLYENDNDHKNDGMNILYGDGHVEFKNMFEAKQEILRQGGK